MQSHRDAGEKTLKMCCSAVLICVVVKFIFEAGPVAIVLAIGAVYWWNKQ